MRIARSLVHVAALAVLVTASRSAAAKKPYASAGVVSLGGAAQLSFSSQTVTPEGFDEGVETDSTLVQLEPIIGYFVIPRLELFGGPLFSLEKESADDLEEDISTTAFGLQAGAGYYVPAGTVFLGPRASIGYARASSEVADNDVSASGFVFEGAGALRVPFGFGGLLEVAAALNYTSLGVEVNDLDAADQTELRFGIELGFFVFF